MLDIIDLKKVYPDGTVGCEDVNISIPEGEAFVILGTSGAGKTTLLQCLSRFLAPTTGKIELNGKDIKTMEHAEFRKHMGIVFQSLNLFPHLTILENMTIAPVKVYDQSQTEADKAAMELLEQLGIENLASSYPGQISGGQAQRVAIGRALILKPDYLLLDEPTSALDKNTTKSLSEMLASLKTDTTFIFVTHDMPFARMTASRGVLMEQGKVTIEGTVEEIEKHWDKVTEEAS